MHFKLQNDLQRFLAGVKFPDLCQLRVCYVSFERIFQILPEKSLIFWRSFALNFAKSPGGGPRLDYLKSRRGLASCRYGLSPLLRFSSNSRCISLQSLCVDKCQRLGESSLVRRLTKHQRCGSRDSKTFG